KIRKHFARAEHHRSQRILGQRNRQSGLDRQPLIEVFQQSTASGQDYATLDNVGGKLRRRALQGDADGVDDRRDGVGQSFANFFVGDGDRFRNAFDQISPPHFVRQFFIERKGGTQFDLNRFRSALADQQIIFSLDVLRDRFVHLVAGNANRF